MHAALWALWALWALFDGIRNKSWLHLFKVVAVKGLALQFIARPCGARRRGSSSSCVFVSMACKT